MDGFGGAEEGRRHTGGRVAALQLQVEALARLVGNVAPTSLLHRRILSELSITADKTPTPLTLDNPQLLKEPYFILRYAEIHAITERDLLETHGEPAAIIRGIKNNLRKIYSTPEHPVSPWAINHCDTLVSHFSNMLQCYTLIAPTDDNGNAEDFEPAHVERLFRSTREIRLLARKVIELLDEDFSRKNAGRAAASVIHGARVLNNRMFAPQDEWIYKKASSKLGSKGDGDQPQQHGHHQHDNGRFRGRRGSGGKWHQGNQKHNGNGNASHFNSKRPREENAGPTSE